MGRFCQKLEITASFQQKCHKSQSHDCRMLQMSINAVMQSYDHEGAWLSDFGTGP